MSQPPPAYGQATAAFGGGGGGAAAGGGGGAGAAARAAAGGSGGPASPAPTKRLKWQRAEAKKFEDLADLFAIIKVRVTAGKGADMQERRGKGGGSASPRPQTPP